MSPGVLTSTPRPRPVEQPGGAIGLEVGGTWVRGARVDGLGAVTERVRAPTPEATEAIAELLASLWQQLGATDAVGLASAPQLDARGTIIRWPSAPQHQGGDLLAHLLSLGARPSVVDDAGAAAVPEHLTATEADSLPSSTLLVSVGTGVGGGFVHDDHLWSGSRGQAVDLGHIPVPAAAGVLCPCGSTACVQAVASGRWATHRAMQLGLSGSTWLDAADRGEARALELLQAMMLPLAQAVTGAVRLLDPDRVILAGGIGSHDAVVRELSRALRAAGLELPVAAGRWGSWAGAIGAAVMAGRKHGDRMVRITDGPAPSGHRIALVQGPNLNLLGEREPQHYGTASLDAIEHDLRRVADSMGCHLFATQANSEGQLIEWLQRRRGRLDGVVINPAGLTAHGHALRDTLIAARVPFIEVHLSNIYAREPLHAQSCFADVASGHICGIGALGYELALRALMAMLDRAHPAGNRPGNHKDNES